MMNTDRETNIIDKKAKEKKLTRIFLFVIFFIYLFLPLDIVPDVLPVIGYVDDIVALIITLYMAFSSVADKLSSLFKKRD